MHIYKKFSAVITALLLVIASLIYGISWWGEESRESIESKESTEFKETNESINYSETKIIEESTSNPGKPSMDLYVFVCGAVARPGVYGLSKEARVYEALEHAGGALEDAALEQLNLARVLRDEETIYVPWVGEESERSSLADGGSDDGLVNLNTASKEELMTLPGIGESRAESILDYRKQVGQFQQIEDVMQVSGIKENAFAKIKELICV